MVTRLGARQKKKTSFENWHQVSNKSDVTAEYATANNKKDLSASFWKGRERERERKREKGFGGNALGKERDSLQTRFSSTTNGRKRMMSLPSGHMQKVFHVCEMLILSR